MSQDKILIVGGYGEVGRRLGAMLEGTRPGRVIVAGRHPKEAGLPSRHIDLEDPTSIEAALEGVGVVVACVRQRKPNLLRAAIQRGIAYTSIAPPWIPWADTAPLRAEAERTGAHIILAAGLEPGISSVLARSAADRLGRIDRIETALLLSLGDTYGPDSMGFIFEEVTEPYTVTIDGRTRPALAFERSRSVNFPEPVGRARAYSMPFRDQLYYPATFGAKTAIAHIALDPPWLADALALALRAGLRRFLGAGGGRERVNGWIRRLRARYAGRDRYALVVEACGGDRVVRSTVVGRGQAEATAAGVAAVVEALWNGEVQVPGVWLAEQVLEPKVYLGRLAEHGIVPSIEERSMLSGPSAQKASAQFAAH